MINKKVALFGGCLCMLFFLNIGRANAFPLKAMTFNVLYSHLTDDGSYSGYKPWAQRKYLVFAIIDRVNPDIFCLQEDTEIQRNDIANHFSNVYSVVPTTLAHRAYSSIFYKTAKYDVIDSGDFQTSIYGPRRTKWAKLKVKDDGTLFFIYNSHFQFGVGEYDEYETDIIRRDSIQTVANHIWDNNGEAVLFMGDLNTRPDQKPIHYITGEKDQFPDMQYHPQFEPMIDLAPDGETFIDYILGTNELVGFNYSKEREYDSDGDAASDHPAVVLTARVAVFITPILQLLLLDEN